MTINSIKQTEQEAVAALPPGFSIEDVYSPIRAAIDLILTPTATETEQTHISEPGPNEVKNDSDINTSGYYKFVTRETVDSSNPEDEFGEKALYSEIEKFRLRQLQRDKYVLKLYFYNYIFLNYLFHASNLVIGTWRNKEESEFENV